MKTKLLIVIAIFIVLGLAATFFMVKISKIKNNKRLASPLVSAAATPSPIPSTELKKYQVPILMYHYIRIPPLNDKVGANLSISPTNFDLQMNYLVKNNYETIKVADLADPSKREIARVINENKKPVSITFDDGYANAYTVALPILKKHHFIGTFFIIRDFVGKDNYLNLKQISKMEEAGMEIGSHTLDHVSLAGQSFDEQKKQISESKEKASVFCYPFGKYDATSVALVKDSGYLAAVTTHLGVANDNSDLFQLPRVRISDNMTVDQFKYQISYAEKHSWKPQ